MKKTLALVVSLALVFAVAAFGVEAADPVASVDGTNYDTLAEAVADAQAPATGKTVTLLKDAAGCGIIVPSGSSFTLDFNGHTYTVNEDPLAGSSGTKTQAFQLLKDSTLIFKNGAIVGDHADIKMLIQNYSNLTLENMTLDATKGTNALSGQYVLSNNSGTVNITGTTSITAKGTGVAFDVYGGFGSYIAPTVNVNTTGTIAGKIEVAKGGAGATGQNTPTLNITAGTINGSLAVSTGLEGDVFVSGGNYTEDVSGFVVAGKVQMVRSGGSGYKVGDPSAAAASAAVNGNTIYYENVADALAANDDVELGADAAGTTIQIPAGKTVTSNGVTYPAGTYTVSAGNVLTVKASDPTPARTNPSTGVSF
ncbi:MAG: hypothetical protein VB092_00920 [Oscillospiraceae bacterium]|nr:hypothetical protein [Oscillospiraceae bacterium]